MGMHWTRDQTVRLIALIKREDPLWNVQNDKYFDRFVREYCFNNIVESMEDEMPDLTLSDVKKRYESLRSQYRKEMRAIAASKRNSPANEVRIPKLWCFHLLEFLNPSFRGSENASYAQWKDNLKVEFDDSNSIPGQTTSKSTQSSNEKRPSSERRGVRLFKGIQGSEEKSMRAKIINELEEAQHNLSFEEVTLDPDEQEEIPEFYVFKKNLSMPQKEKINIKRLHEDESPNATVATEIDQEPTISLPVEDNNLFHGSQEEETSNFQDLPPFSNEKYLKIEEKKLKLLEEGIQLKKQKLKLEIAKFEAEQKWREKHYRLEIRRLKLKESANKSGNVA